MSEMELFFIIYYRVDWITCLSPAEYHETVVNTERGITCTYQQE